MDDSNILLKDLIFHQDLRETQIQMSEMAFRADNDGEKTLITSPREK